MVERAMRLMVDDERGKLDPDVLDDPFIRSGLAMIAHGVHPAQAWREVAQGMAMRAEYQHEQIMKLVSVQPPPSILMCSGCPHLKTVSREDNVNG